MFNTGMFLVMRFHINFDLSLITIPQETDATPPSPKIILFNAYSLTQMNPI